MNPNMQRAKAAYAKEGAIASLLIRLIVGTVVWAVGTAALVALMLLSAVPYGGGSVGPLYLVVPWTAAVIFWALMPLRDIPMLSALGTRLFIFAAALGTAIGSMYWWLGSGERQRASADRSFAAAFEPHSAYFEKACAKARSSVLRQIPDVAGVLVYGIRAKTEPQDLKDKGFVGDVYSQIDTSFDPEAAFAAQFLIRSDWAAFSHTPTEDEASRYSFVEVPAEVDGIAGFYRYTGVSVISGLRTTREFVRSATSSYAIRIEDISSAEDREHWIAATRWSVLDVKTNEVLGEFSAYAMDTLQGKTVFEGGFGNAGEPRAPWLRAGHVQYRLHGTRNACPEKDVVQQRLNSRDFVRSVLVPVKQQ